MRHILYGVNYQTLIMMMSDVPKYVSGKRETTYNSNRTAEDEASGIANFFASKLTR